MIKSVLIFFISTFSCMALGQSSLSSDYEKVLQEFYANNYQESVYIHTDKDYYLTGETIRLAVYCLESLTSKPTQLSKVAYADVVDREKNTILTARIELKNGVGSGEIYIPTSVASGYVVLRGYTQWMRNYGPETYYHSVITIINPFRKLPQRTSDDQPAMSFYPEGGILLEGVASNIVFQGKSSTGNLADFSGLLMTADSIALLSFRPQTNGLGSFTLTPETGQRYMVKMILPDSTFTFHPLPTASAEGVSLQVHDEGSAFEITMVDKTPSNHQPFQVLLHHNATVIDTRTLGTNEKTFQWKIDKKTLPPGIFHVSLLNSNTLLLQRTVYHHSGLDEPEGNIVVSASVGRREALPLDVENLKKSMNADLNAFSISVSAKTPDFLPNQADMQELKLIENSIEQPFALGSYFQVNDDVFSGVINNLLIAYPKTVKIPFSSTTGPSMKYLPEYRGMLVTGRIVDKVSGEPANGIFAYLSIPGRNTQFFGSKSRNDGSIAFELKNVYGENEMVVQTNYTRDTTYRIEIDNPYSRDYMNVELPEFTLNEKLADWLVEKSQQMQVVNAYQKYNPAQPLITELDSSAFYHKPDFSYILDDYTRFIVMEEVMREYVAGVNVRKNKEGFHFMVVDISKNIVYEENPLMLLDGVPVFDADEIIAMDPLKIQRIQSVNRRFGHGIIDCQGIVNYTTYKGNLSGYSLHPGVLAFRYDGLQVPTIPAKLLYNQAALNNNRTPDFRNSIFWATSITNPEPGIDVIYTSDVDGEYKIIVNALSSDGNILTATDEFTVK